MTRLQKSLAKTAALLSLLAGLGFYAYQITYKGGQEAKKREQREAQLFSFEQGEVVYMQLVKRLPEGGLREIMLKRENPDEVDPRWHIKSPVKVKADDTIVPSVVGRIANLTRLRVVDEAGTKLAPYGLDTPGLEAHLTLKDGSRRTLLVGSDNSFDNSVYVRRSDRPQVMLAEGHLRGAIDKELFELRNKAVIRTDIDRLIGISSEWKLPGQDRPDGGVANTTDLDSESNDFFIVEKIDPDSELDDWRLVAPMPDDADRNVIRDIKNNIRYLRMEAVASESDANLARYGLDEPTVRLTLTYRPEGPEGELEKVRLLVGSEVSGRPNRSYAKLESEPAVLEIPKRLTAQLTRTTYELRKKDVLAFDRDRVAAIMVAARSGEIVKVEKDPTKEPDAEDLWLVTEPHTAVAKRYRVSALLSDLSQLKAKGFGRSATGRHLDAFDLDDPVRTYVLTEADGAEIERLLIGKNEDGDVYVTNRLRRRIYIVDASRLKDLPTSAADFEDKPSED